MYRLTMYLIMDKTSCTFYRALEMRNLSRARSICLVSGCELRVGWSIHSSLRRGKNGYSMDSNKMRNHLIRQPSVITSVFDFFLSGSPDRVEDPGVVLVGSVTGSNLKTRIIYIAI